MLASTPHTNGVSRLAGCAGQRRSGNVAEPHGTNGTPPTDSRILTLDSGRRPLGKSGDWVTRKEMQETVARALADEVPKVHEFYLKQIPDFVARMIQDALLHYGLIKPVEPVDIQPKPEGVAVAGESTPAAGSPAASLGNASVDAGPSDSDPEAAHPSDGLADRPIVPDVVAVAVAYYAIPGNEVGGRLHIVLDDGNVDDSSVEFCRKAAMEVGDKEGERLAELLARMTTTQRQKVYCQVHEVDTRGSA